MWANWVFLLACVDYPLSRASGKSVLQCTIYPMFLNSWRVFALHARLHFFRLDAVRTWNLLALTSSLWKEKKAKIRENPRSRCNTWITTLAPQCAPRCAPGWLSAGKCPHLAPQAGWEAGTSSSLLLSSAQAMGWVHRDVDMAEEPFVAATALSPTWSCCLKAST